MLKAVATLALVTSVQGCVKCGPSEPAQREVARDASAWRGGNLTSPHPVSTSDAGDASSARPDAGAVSAVPPTAARGRILYDRYCGFCHGTEGKGYAADEAPALANEELLPIASDEYLSRAISRGRPGTTMSAWSITRGGPLFDNDVAAIVMFLRGWQKPSKTSLASDAGPPGGDAKRAEPVYTARCASCHGKEGHGGKYIELSNPELLGSASDAFLAASIEHGRPGTPMVALGGKIPATGIADLVALLRSWQKPVDEVVVLPPKPGELTNVVINPKGPPPKFDEKADFTPVDVVKREIDRGASVVIADARAPSDYVKSHVAGAVSVPFYEVDKYVKQIPKDRFVITYCACPHAVSVKSRDALIQEATQVLYRLTPG